MGKPRQLSALWKVFILTAGYCFLEFKVVTADRNISRYFEESSRLPVTGNLLIGRADRLSASSTCGLYKEQRYCIVSHLEEKKKCFKCDSRDGEMPQTSHRIKNIIYRKDPRSKMPSWWQSENGKENVTIQLDLEAEFYFTHLIMWFRTFRPAALIVERSWDYGETWKPYRYFAENCAAVFPGTKTSKTHTNPSEVICDESYSKSTPVTNGEVILRIIPPHMKLYDPYSTQLQNLMKITNLRINFTKLHTLGDDLLDKRQEIQEKYYYALYEMVVRGFCWCHGHAEKCLPLNDDVKDTPGMIHGRCDCSHNTTGRNCRKCKDTHNDLPWKPAIGQVINACKKCNCNEHALRCNFSNEVYQQSGHISGSVCINCEDNTMGNNCELCMPRFYHDPVKRLTDQYTCLPCHCNEEGTIDGGLCDSPITSLENRVCHCKDNVEGHSCDRCKAGFWNLQDSNPQGCEPCTCDENGTVNSSCDPYSGECECKPNVYGKDCNQCFIEHWGLSKDSDGCQPCDCDVGGSTDSNCDVNTGKCNCYPHLTGRACTEAEQGFFVKDLDLVYEAEDANHSDNCQVEILEWPIDSIAPWTGNGYMRVHDNSELEFIIDDIPHSMEYDLIIRYDKVKKHELIDVIATLDRLRVHKGDVCSNTQDSDDVKQLHLQSGALYTNASTPLCLEEGKSYKLKLTFTSNSNQVDIQTASIIIDSIALVPKIDSLEIFNDSPKNEERKRNYKALECHETFYLPAGQNISEECKPYHFSISVKVHKGASECNCNGTGSLSAICDPNGGRCSCKTKVKGRTCDRCAEGTYGFFSSDGCRDCDCNAIGAVDNICDISTGQCNCKNGTYGRICDQCQLGSWGFPNCQPCQCNGHAHICNSTTGECIGCRDSTTGYSCDKCADGFYGEPTTDSTCRPCSCPDTVESGHSFASTCVKSSLDVIRCICKDGYKGPRCDKCDDNFYGHPEKIDGSCQGCNCNGNIDLSQTGNCNPHTGECLQCLYNTTGSHCEICKPDYFGDASEHKCDTCDCDLLGTDKSKGPCDPITGQCPCLPNVKGRKCEECAPEHWLIAKGIGCIPCECDPVGAENPICNAFTGVCMCKSGFGGDKCTQCQGNFWGDPNVECYPCECDSEGAEIGKCNQDNGTCICREGITGDKCDMCSRGFKGDAPYCSKCGECFDNWDLTIRNLADETDKVIRDAKEIRQTGTPGYNAVVFDTLSSKIDDVNKTLRNTKSNSIKLNNISKEVENFRSVLNASMDTVNILSTKVQTVISNVTFANHMFTLVKERTQALKNYTQELSNNATDLQEKYLKGALNITREAGISANNVTAIEKRIESSFLSVADRQCKRTEKFLNKDNETFTKTEQKNEGQREQLDFELSLLEKKIPVLNEMICGGSGMPCDNLCGGAGCGRCGIGIACGAGAVGKADAGLKLAERYKDQIAGNLTKADGLLRNISNAKQQVTTAHKAALKVHDIADNMKKRFEGKVMDLSEMNEKLQEFLNESGATPAEIKAIVNKIMDLHIQLKPQQIKDLALQINNTIASLTDVNSILEATKKDHDKAILLKKKSDEAKMEAEDILGKAQKVVDGLETAKTAQKKADEKIKAAHDDIGAIKKELRQIVSETDAGWSKINNTKQDVENIKGKLKQLQTEVLQNEHGVKQILSEADKVSKQVDNTKQQVTHLIEDYKKVNNSIISRSPLISDNSKSRAQKLLERARLLSLGTTAKLKELKEADTVYNEQKKKLTFVTGKVDDLTNKMMKYTTEINLMATQYREC